MKKMSMKDAIKALAAVRILEKLNKKYKYPHGKNPGGIIFSAYDTINKNAEKRNKKHAEE